MLTKNSKTLKNEEVIFTSRNQEFEEDVMVLY